MHVNILQRNSIFLLLLVFMSSCGSEQEKNLQRKWKTFSLKNMRMEREIASMKVYIDTLGRQDPALRATMNLDSTKKVLQAGLDQTLQQQAFDRDNTVMEFSSNGIVYTTTAESADSARYTLEENTIKIDEAAIKGHGETMTFEILSLSADTLKLRVIDYGDTSLITMIPVQ